MKQYTLYTLKDPFTNQIRYIGLTNRSLKVRLGNHYSDVHKNNYKSNWIKSLKKRKAKPIIEELDIAYSLEEAHFFERYWISQFKTWGFKLTNSTLGGEGGLGYKHSEVNIEKMKHFWANKPKKVKPIKLTKDQMYTQLSLALSKPVLQYDLDGNFIKKWNSQKEAAIFYNTKSNTIGHALKNPEVCAVNYLWRRFDTPIKKIKAYTKTGNKNKITVVNVITQEKIIFNSNSEAFKVIGRPSNPSLYIDTEKVYKKQYKLYRL
jgi:hypothetical protein